MKTNLNINVYQSRNEKIFGHLCWVMELLPSDVMGVMKKQNVRDLNLHKPRILTQKSNDIFKCGSSFKIKLVNHL
jgi:hypothetical protein